MILYHACHGGSVFSKGEISMATKERVREYVINYLAKVRGVDPSEIDDDTPTEFHESHGIVMFAMVHLQELHVMIHNDEDTVRDLVNMIASG